MTAAQRQTVKVYIADFSRVGTKAGFYRRLTAAFGLKASALPVGLGHERLVHEQAFWQELCRRVAHIASTQLPVRIRIIGAENVYVQCRVEMDRLLRILRAAEENAQDLRADVKLGNAIWKI